MLYKELEKISGVYAFNANRELDDRGSLTAFAFREDQPRHMEQLNVVRSTAGVLRGIHAHADYDEFYVPIDGRFYFVLCDSRKNSASFGQRIEFEVDTTDFIGFRVPSGVAHGALFISQGTLAYGISKVWNGQGEFGCRWDDPDLKFNWPVLDPILSEKDTNAGSYNRLVDELNELVRPR